MKICHVITRMIVGGAQENTWLTVRGLREKGHQVTLLTGPAEGPEGRLLEHDSCLTDVEVVEEPCLLRRVAPLNDLRVWRRMREFFRDRQFDIVHTHSSKAGILGRFTARGNTPGVLHTIHGLPFHAYQNRLLNSICVQAEKMAARRCDYICAVAQAMTDQAVAAGIGTPEQYRTVYSGMELEPYLTPDPRAAAELRQRWNIPQNAPVIGKIARLFDLKGHEFLIAAAPEIIRRFPEVIFLLVGDGVLRPRLERMVEEKGLMNNFVFTGLVSPSEIPSYIELMDGLVHLSLREGLPRTAVQALAGGKPVAAFALDGTPEVVKPNETGFLCPPEDIDSVQRALLQMLEEPEESRRMGLAGRELVRRMFDWRLMVERLEDLYKLTLNKQAVE